MNLANEKPDVTAALTRLLSDSALWRAALGACATPVAIVDASTPQRAVTYVNPAFESYFGYRRGEAHGQPLAGVLFRGDEPLVHRLLAAPGSRWQLKSWTKADTLKHVDLALGAVRNPEGRVTYWVLSFSDRAEAEVLRAELERLRPAAAA